MPHPMTFEKVVIRPNPEGSPHYKRWESSCGNFRIEWRNRMQGVRLEPAYFRPAYKRIFEGKPQWVMIGKGHHRTIGGAKKVCMDWAKRNVALLAG
jgi:hypothetical protein